MCFPPNIMNQERIQVAVYNHRKREDGVPLTTSKPLHPKQPHVSDAMATGQKMGERSFLPMKNGLIPRKAASAKKLPIDQMAGVLQGR